jgi:anti-anti-sigma factor
MGAIMWSSGAETGRIVVLSGRLDASTVSALRERMNAAVDGGVGQLVVDMSAVGTIDVTGLNMLLGARRRAKRADREMVLRGVPVRVARLLKVTRLDRVLREESGTGAAVA